MEPLCCCKQLYVALVAQKRTVLPWNQGQLYLPSSEQVTESKPVNKSLFKESNQSGTGVVNLPQCLEEWTPEEGATMGPFSRPMAPPGPRPGPALWGAGTGRSCSEWGAPQSGNESGGANAVTRAHTRWRNLRGRRVSPLWTAEIGLPRGRPVTQETRRGTHWWNLGFKPLFDPAV